jgi:rubrerythrin
MFTLSDLRDIAIQIERNGVEAYRSASQRIVDPEIAAVVALMAEEELRHLNWFKQLSTGVNAPSEHPEIEAMGRSLLKEMMESRTFSLGSEPLQRAVDVSAVLSQSLGFEEDTILFYNTLGAFIETPAAKDQLEEIIAEERRHVEMIERMMAAIQTDGGRVDA